MPHSAKILADSLSPDGVRLTTFEVTLPRVVLAEFNTHRVFSRCSASSRAIPVSKMLSRVIDDPYIPTIWGKNQRGMQASVELQGHEKEMAKTTWLKARDSAVSHVEILLSLGLHKQITNRLLEPWLWHTVICTATEWSNFFHLRNHLDANPDIQIPAQIMQQLHENSTPLQLRYEEWHLPLVVGVEYTANELYKNHELGTENVEETYDFDWRQWVKVSCARCARISYLTHDGIRSTEEDLKLYGKLLSKGHMSPFEFAARPAMLDDIPDEVEALSQKQEELDAQAATLFYGNFRGWVQHRKEIVGEADILGSRQCGKV